MKILLNSEIFSMGKEYESLNELLQHIQEEMAKNKMTIVGVNIDGIEHNIDFFDKDNNMGCEFIEEINIKAKSIQDVCIDVIEQMNEYLEKITIALPSICEKYRKNDHIDATQDLYNILEGLKYFNIAFNSMASMNVLDIESNKVDETTFLDSLVDVNDSFLLIIDDLKNENYIPVAEKIESDITNRISKLSHFMEDFKNQIVE